MDILIPDNWLKEYLKTKATSKEIAQKLSLCGPSVEKVSQTPYGPVYSIEVTTNRIDTACVYGIAREASAILPRFGIKALLKPIKLSNLNLVQKVKYLNVDIDANLCPRFTAVLIRNVKIGPSPKWMQDRLRAVGERPINNIVDISNYLMHESGQPMHTFDYDKIKGAKMILRESKKGEKVITLDGETRVLPGKDIIIEDGEGRLIDLCGIMGGELSAIDKNTKNVLLFVQTYNPVYIRRTSMKLAHRTAAAVIFEKATDPELVLTGLQRGIDLFVDLAKGKPEKKVLDLYFKPYKPRYIKINKKFIEERLGVPLSQKEIIKILSSLGFEIKTKGQNYEIKVPSYRAIDVEIPEDIVEEVARIYGYHNLKSDLMTGALPNVSYKSPFDFEVKLKRILKGYGGVEIYTSSLVPESFVDKNALKLKNPLGPESAYLRTSLMPSLIKAADDNVGIKDIFHLYEMSNVYLPRIGNLPEEKMMLAGIFFKVDYREVKGVIEALLEELNIDCDYITEDAANFLPSQRLVIKKNNKNLGQIGNLDGDLTYYEFDIELLRNNMIPRKYQDIPKFPPQIEDITLEFPPKTKIGEVAKTIESNSLVRGCDLSGVYKGSFTFRIWFQDLTKTLTDKEVEKTRNKILQTLKIKHGGIIKS
jgi:phenylalanyl-tRNA synthetase beta chain